LLQGIRGKLLQLHALRLAAAAKSAIADFRYQFKHNQWMPARAHVITCCESVICAGLLAIVPGIRITKSARNTHKSLQFKNGA